MGSRGGCRGLSSHIFVGSRGGCGGLSRWLRWALTVAAVGSRCVNHAAKLRSLGGNSKKLRNFFSLRHIYVKIQVIVIEVVECLNRSCEELNLTAFLGAPYGDGIP